MIHDGGRPTVELYQMKLKLTRKGGNRADMVLSKSCTVGVGAQGMAYVYRRMRINPLEECVVFP